MTKRDKTKDMFYNAVDYLVMLVIIIGVITILGWKFELLFNKGTVDDPNEVVTEHTEKDVNPSNSDTKVQDIEEIDAIDKKDSNSQENADNNTTTENPPQEEENTTPPPTEEPEETTTPAETTTPETPTPSGEEVTINIPAGTLPGATGQILADNGLVESAEAFVNKAVELKLDRKLKSGEFKLKKGMTIDQIVKAIAKVN